MSLAGGPEELPPLLGTRVRQQRSAMLRLVPASFRKPITSVVGDFLLVFSIPNVEVPNMFLLYHLQLCCVIVFRIIFVSPCLSALDD